MDEQIIRTLQEQAIEERQYIQEKYGQDEDVVQVFRWSTDGII